MANSLILRNAKRLKKAMADEINYTDLDFDLRGRRGITTYYGDALVVSYIIWLRSMEGDFIRNPTRGGFFRNQLNRYKFSPESEQRIADDLRQESTLNFPDINILDIRVTCVYNERKWKVEVAVEDKKSKIIALTGVSYNIETLSVE